MENIVWENYKEAIAKYFVKANQYNKANVFKGRTTYITNWNIYSSFDIETYTNENDQANMYVWQWGFGFYPDDYVVCMGRTWEDFMILYHDVVELKSKSYPFHVYVHNLAYEFQFIRKRLKWRQKRSGDSDLFCTDLRKVCYAVTEDEVVFHDSLIYTASGLETVGKNLTKYKVQKMVGDLDYTEPRNCFTPLDEKEIGYCVNDVLVVMAKIREDCEFNNCKIADLVMTNTGNVRNELLDFYNSESEGKKRCIRTSRLTRKSYYVMSESYTGGFTHCNPVYSGVKLSNIASIDFCSSYPAVMLSEWYPFGTPKYYENLNPKDASFKQHWCGLIKLTKVRLKEEAPDGWIPVSHCKKIKGEFLFNGKVFSADYLETYFTDVDFEMVNKYYHYDMVEYGEGLIFPYSLPLPPFIREALYKMYAGKTSLKNVDGKEAEYLRSKGMFNSAYGCTVQRVLMDKVVYKDDQWYRHINTDEDKEELIHKYNFNDKRTLYYAIGVWVTAFARRNLLNGIWEMGDDFVYSDTDSIKFRHLERHLEYIKRYNQQVTYKLKAINGEDNYNKYLKPKDIHGEEHPLGVWEIEGVYKYFKGLRAKAYMYTDENDKLHLTLAGVSKKEGLKYFEKQSNPYEAFNLKVAIPAKYTGKLVHKYIDSPDTWTVVDKYGNEQECTEYSWVALQPTTFEMDESTGNVLQAIANMLREERQK